MQHEVRGRTIGRVTEREAVEVRDIWRDGKMKAEET